MASLISWLRDRKRDLENRPAPPQPQQRPGGIRVGVAQPQQRISGVSVARPQGQVKVEAARPNPLNILGKIIENTTRIAAQPAPSAPPQPPKPNPVQQIAQTAQKVIQKTPQGIIARGVENAVQKVPEVPASSPARFLNNALIRPAKSTETHIAQAAQGRNPYHGNIKQQAGQALTDALNVASVVPVGKGLQAATKGAPVITKVAKTIKATAPSSTAIGGGYGLSSSLENNLGAKDTVKNVGINAGLGLGASVVLGSAPLAVPAVKGITKGTVNLGKGLKELHVNPKPFKNITDDELNSVSKVRSSQTNGFHTPDDLDFEVTKNVSRKLGIKDLTELDDVLLKRNAYDSRQQQLQGGYVKAGKDSPELPKFSNQTEDEFFQTNKPSMIPAERSASLETPVSIPDPRVQQIPAEKPLGSLVRKNEGSLSPPPTDASYPNGTPVKINVKGAMSDADYIKRYGKAPTPNNVKVKPFTQPEIDYKNWNDKNALGLGRETLERNLDRVAGKDAPAVKKFLVDASRENETKRVDFGNQLRQSTRDNVVKNLGIKKGSQESALVQQHGEGLINEQEIVQAVGPEKAQKIIHASDYFRQQYDNLLDTWNSQRAKYGYDPIPKRPDYFRHFQAIDNMGSILGTIRNARDLPTGISGITDIFNPNQPFSDAALGRTGNKTTYDAVGGFDNYIDSVSKQIFHTDTVQRGRAIEGTIRKQANADPTLELPNFVANLHEWTNIVSGKKTRLDRASEAVLGRKVYAAGMAIRQKTGANMIGANLGSAITNYIPLTQAAATTSKPAMAKAVADTVSSSFAKDVSIVDGVKSSFLTRRFPDEAIGYTKMQNASRVASSPFKLVDRFTSRTIVAGKYFEGLSKGLNKQQAMKAADDYASRTITDRSLGQMPNLLETKTTGFISQFQAEVNNQVSFLGRDIPLLAGGNKAKIGSSLAQFAVYSYLANEMYEKVLGRRVQLDPVDAGLTVADGDKSTDQKINAVKEDVLGGLPFTSIFTGGRLPVSAMMPDAKSIGSGISHLKDDPNRAGREIFKGISGPLFYGAPPFGGGQVKKTLEDAMSQGKGYSETASGNVRFPMPTDTLDKARGLVFGQYSTKPGQEYIDRLPKPLSEKQSADFKSKQGQDRLSFFDSIINKREETKTQPVAEKTGTGGKKPELTGNSAIDQIKEENRRKDKAFKASLSKEDYALATMNKRDREKLLASGKVTQEKLDGLDNYVRNKKKELGIPFKESKPKPKPVSNPISPDRYKSPTTKSGKWAQHITESSKRRGLDPDAVLAVAAVEGLSGGVGDGGNAFGPFQLNQAGGVITGRFKSSEEARAFAESPEGIEFALDHIEKVAKGKKGQDAINAIVHEFERPADPHGEVARALGVYGRVDPYTKFAETSGQGDSTYTGRKKSSRKTASGSTRSTGRKSSGRRGGRKRPQIPQAAVNAAIKIPKVTRLKQTKKLTYKTPTFKGGVKIPKVKRPKQKRNTFA